MWLFVAIILFLLWLGGFVLFHVAAFLLHVFLIVAVVALMVHLFTGGRL